MSNDSSDNTSDDNNTNRRLSERVLGASTNPYAIHRLGQEYHKTPSIQAIQKPPPCPTRRRRGNQSSKKNINKNKVLWKDQTGCTATRSALPGALATTDRGGMLVASSITTNPSNCAGHVPIPNDVTQEFSSLKAAMSPGSKMVSSVSTRVENLIDLLAQIQLNSEEEVNGGNGGNIDAESKEFEIHLQAT